VAFPLSRSNSLNPISHPWDHVTLEVIAGQNGATRVRTPIPYRLPYILDARSLQRNLKIVGVVWTRLSHAISICLEKVAKPILGLISRAGCRTAVAGVSLESFRVFLFI
jgi:hypothetical protein